MSAFRLRGTTSHRKPRTYLQACGNQITVCADNGFRRSRGAATEQKDGVVIGRRRGGRAGARFQPCIVSQATLKPHITRLELNAVAALLL